MTCLTAKLASAVVACLAVAASVTALANAANAADCLTERGPRTPEGDHWFYRLERGTQRHCWYLRSAGGKASQAAPASGAPSSLARQVTPQPLPGEAPAQAGGTPAQRNQAAAPAQAAAAPPGRQTLPSGPGQGAAAEPAQASAPPSVDMATPALSPASSPPAARAPADGTMQAPAAVARDPGPDAQAAAVIAPRAPAPANPPAEKPRPAAVSLQMLLLVILGALALAGLTASFIYRYGQRRQTVRMTARERRAAIRQSFANARRPPWAEQGTGDRTAPPNERIAPLFGPAAPRVDEAAPRLARAAPRHERSTPHIKRTAPHLVRTARKSSAVRSAAPARTSPDKSARIEDLLSQLLRGQQSDA